MARRKLTFTEKAQSVVSRIRAETRKDSNVHSIHSTSGPVSQDEIRDTVFQMMSTGDIEWIEDSTGDEYSRCFQMTIKGNEKYPVDMS